MKSRNRAIIFGLLLLSLALLFGAGGHYLESWATGLDLTAKAAAVGGLLALAYQLRRERDLTEADFIVRLNESFLAGERTHRIYRLLECSKKEKQKEDPFTDADIIDMANYLSFFGPLLSLVERGLIEMRTVDIFAYRFLLATNNKYMQDRLLHADGKADAWSNVYRLHKRWSRYRRKKALPIWQEEHDLSKVSGYREMTYED
ncbi:MAG: hypothetical protein SX243_25030 [Acidobacteriota bacterium]|nr:hypothetical protein [Acidobacteriota bacterium]